MKQSETIWNNLQAVGITFSIIESEHVHCKEKHNVYSLKGEIIWNNLHPVGITFSIIESEHVHCKEKHHVKQSQG